MVARSNIGRALSLDVDLPSLAEMTFLSSENKASAQMSRSAIAAPTTKRVRFEKSPWGCRSSLRVFRATPHDHLSRKSTRWMRLRSFVVFVLPSKLNLVMVPGRSTPRRVQIRGSACAACYSLSNLGLYAPTIRTLPLFGHSTLRPWCMVALKEVLEAGGEVRPGWRAPPRVYHAPDNVYMDGSLLDANHHNMRQISSRSSSRRGTSRCRSSCHSWSRGRSNHCRQRGLQ